MWSLLKSLEELFFLFVCLGQSFSVVLEHVLELALVDQAGLELSVLASASPVLGLKACATTAPLELCIFKGPM